MASVLPFPNAADEQVVAEQVPRRLRIGDELVRSGVLSETVLDDALQAQKLQDQKIGRILIANRVISDDDLVKALSRQSGLHQIDLEGEPCDPTLLRYIDPYRCLELEAVPWRAAGGTLVVALANPEVGQKVLDLFDDGIAFVTLALAKPADIKNAIVANCAGRMRQDARTRCPEVFSCRGWTQAAGKFRRLKLAFGALATLALLAPLSSLQIVLAWILIANTATMALRLTALFARASGQRPVRRPSAADGVLRAAKLPRVSVIVPLLREEAIAERLLAALRSMDYPAPLLDIKLVLEEDDDLTRAAIARAALPPTIEVIVVPADGLKTKPKAMNYALPFCLGDIVGIYDAEDEPDPAQIRRVVEHLLAAPPDVACVQGFLDFYNTRQNWLSRCFTLEYGIWFRIVLLGVQRLGFPIPLGGTTVFFRRHLLERIGAWDAHNVTEDADLGMRLARFGYRCEMVASTTMEEANCRPLRWIRQRSRWLKGYVVTWTTHMRAPRALLRDLGWRGFIGFQVLFLGSITAYLSLPLFWAIWIGALGFGMEPWQGFPDWMLTSFFISMISGQIVMLVSAIVASLDMKRAYLIAWVPSLIFYWPLGAIAAFLAVGEVFSRPSYWHKTDHGHSVLPGRPAPKRGFTPRVVSPPPEGASRTPG
jgi:glycosyltransferase XagB